MGRPEPCVLFAQTFVHSHLDEYVDEVLFAEPVVVTACEFLEQNASSASQSVTLVGATSPPSFALEVFVQCEGESRFRRLCQPFLYSHSSSNVLDVEAVVTNHLVVRGSYRSLSLVVYGNTAEDLGQFNIEFDDNSLTNIVSSVDGDLEDLPLPLRSIKFINDKFSCSLHALSVPVSVLGISLEVKQLLQLILKLLQVDKSGGAVQKAVNTLLSTASAYIVNDSSCEAIHQKSLPRETAEFQSEINQCRKELIEHYRVLQEETGDTIPKSFQDFPFLESDSLPSTKQLVDMLGQYFQLGYETSSFGHPSLSKNKNVMLWLGTSLFLCSSKESCFHFVNSGGVEQLRQVFCHDLPSSTTAVLLLLGVLEQATRHSVGCDRFLGWWPREDEKVPSRISEGYSQLLRLLLEKPRHDVASLASYILCRLRVYEVLSRYECAVLSALGRHCTDDGSDSSCLNFLMTAKSQLKNLVKLLNSPGSVEDPSLVALASRSLMLGQSEGGLSYKATSGLITSSNSCLFNWDNNLHLLDLLKERGFWPLSIALLSLSTLQSEVGNGIFLNMEIMRSIGAILFSLLRSRSGLLFLAHQAELSDALIEALKGADSAKKDDCLPLRYASSLISKGFLCVPREIGMILEMHLRVVNVIDHLLTSTPHSEEFLWVLWELCAFSRSECGRKALLIIGYFPEAVSALIGALRSVKEPEPAPIAGASPLDVAIFHSAAEIFEFIVMDSMASSLGSWIGYAAELHGALHSSSPGSNRKDAPTRLLEWIDAGVVYHKNGAIGLLRYVAVLASGGDAHLTSTSVLVSDLMDVDHGIGDTSGGSEINVMENLGKIVSEKTFDGVVLRDSAIAQLTTAFRILAFISENSTVASELYHEGAIPVVYAVLVNCRFMLERSSNSYDYLVDDGTECNSTSDLLLERNREQSLVDLLVPTMVLLVSLLQKLQEAHEQHRNTKLMNALLRLHKEVSPKLAACAADLSSPYPDSALGFEALCHLVVSALAYWPVLGWTPGLFHSLLTNVQATSALSLGPKEICSLLCVLNDLFPDEGIWLWKNSMPALSALRTLAIGSILGPQKEKEVNWYLKPEHHAKVLGQLRPHLDKIAEMVQHCAISALVVIQDMLRVFIVRIACQKVEYASVLIRPILSWVLESVDLSCCPSEMDAYKLRRYLDFLASLLEHPQAKSLLLKEGIIEILQKVLERCLDAIDSGGSDFVNWAGPGFTMYGWCLPVLKSISLICGSGKPEQYSDRYDLHYSGMSSGDCGLILPSLLKCFQVVPFGKELLACVGAFEELGSSAEGRRALLDTFFDVHSKTELHDSDTGQERQQINDHKELRWIRYPPLLCCWKKLWSSFVSRDDISGSAVEGLKLLSTGCLYFCRDGKSLDLKGVSVVKYLFGLSEDTYTADGSLEENMNYVKGVATFLSSKVTDHDHEATATPTYLYQVLKSAELLLSLLQKPDSDINTVDVSMEVFPSNKSISPKFHMMGDADSDKADDILLSGGLVEKFLWDCPETLPDKTVLPMKRKLSSVDATGRRGRAENVAADSTVSGTFSRGSGPVAAPPAPTRRDTFRLRKPNTSRPPSMHVDDYVARERNADGGSDVIAIPRGPTSGRPPSIHVDEFMARQRERQSSSATVVGEAIALVKNAAAPPLEKVDKQKQLKTDIEDDLQGIDIVFDGEESETDDKLPFPHLDENLQQPAPIENSPRSIVEETESDTHGSGQFSRMGTPTASNADEISSRMSVSRTERPLTREPSVTSDKKFDQPSDHMGKSSGYPGMYNSGPGSSSGRARMSPQTSYPKQSPQYQGNLPYNVAPQGPYDPRFMQTQPPLPPMPPPPSVLSQSDSQSNTAVDGQQQSIPAAFQVQQDYMSTYNNSPSGPIRPLPPLPPTPPPFLSNPYNLKAQNMQSAPYGQTNVPYPPTHIMPSMIYNNRPQSVPMSSYMTSPMQQQQQQQQLSENPMQSHLSAVQTMHQLQPLQPPLLPPQPPHHLHRPLVPQSSDQGFLAQSSSGTVQGSSLHMMQQQPQFAPPVNTFYQSQQPESSHAQQSFQQVEQQQQHPQQQKDAGISLADYFKSPEDIQALLSDREKLCQLLEQHPKLMQMLQEKLGQL